MDPEKLKEWQLIIQNTLVCVLGVFVIVYEVVARAVPDQTAIGAGLTLLLAPPLRSAYFAHKKKVNGTEN